MSVIASSTTLVDALHNSDRYLKLPRFQRKYRWPIKGISKDDNVTNLFDDIVSNMGRGINSKFVGSILIHDEMQHVVLPNLMRGEIWDDVSNIWKRGTKADFQNLCATHGVQGWNLRTSRNDLISLLVNFRRERRA